MYLSYQRLSDMGEKIFSDFNYFFFGRSFDQKRDYVLPMMIDRFAKDYLGLNVEFAVLSDDGSICGLTAYADTEYKADGKVLPLRQNEVILDESFMQPGMVGKLCEKRRFTLAHECAHQILFRYVSDSEKQSFRKMYSERRTYSLRDLKNKEDWNERQANILASAIMMPRREINFAMQQYAGGRKLVSYDGWFGIGDYKIICKLAENLGVSKKALIIRLNNLGYVRDDYIKEAAA